jgi:phosphoribosylformylglycinamidine synthase
MLPSHSSARGQDALATKLLKHLAHPNVASKHWIIRQYDHEVQGGSVIKPLTGPHQRGPSDAAVLRPKLDSCRGIVLACGLAPQISDPYQMAIASVDEAIRNAVCVGASLDHLAILDNFCWPSVEDEQTMGALVAACEACRDAALAYGVPFISGKDSLHNQFTIRETGEVLKIPNTLLISAIGIIEDVRRCITMDFKRAGNHVYLVRPRGISLRDFAALHSAISSAIAERKIVSCHDVSEGGALIAVAEMCIASGLGAQIERADPEESLASYVIECAQPIDIDADVVLLGRVADAPHLAAGDERISIVELTGAWRGTLDW